jgi:hypothetical protein
VILGCGCAGHLALVFHDNKTKTAAIWFF